MQGRAGRGHGGSDHLLLCRYRGHVLVAGSQGAGDLLIVVFAPGLRKTIAPCPGSGGPVGVECGVNSISNAPRSDRMPITCKSTIRRRSWADS